VSCVCTQVSLLFSSFFKDGVSQALVAGAPWGGVTDLNFCQIGRSNGKTTRLSAVMPQAAAGIIGAENRPDCPQQTDGAWFRGLF